MTSKLKWGRGILHKILQGPDAGLYLPFGLSRLRALERISPEYCFTQRFKMPGYDIHVEQVPPVQYVKIVQNGDMAFEFATSGNPVVHQVYPPITGTDAYKSVIVSVKLKANRALTAYEATPTIAGQKRTFVGVDVSPLGRSVQVDMLDEPVDQRNGHNVFSSWAPKHPWSGAYHRGAVFYAGTAFHAFLAPLSAQQVRDVGFDVPHGFSYRIQPIVHSYLQNPADWPRASGMQTVTSKDWGNRRFAIYVDAKGQFSVYPVQPITHVDQYTQNILPKYVQIASPVLPAAVWVNTTLRKTYGGSAQDALADFVETDWKFAPDGKKACAIMLWRTPFEFDSAYFGSSPTANPLTLANFNHLRDNLGTLGHYGFDFNVDPTHHTPQRYHNGAGIVEVVVGITLTGPNPEDFELTLATNIIRDGSTNEYFPFVVGYSWYDNTRLGVKKGDLISLDIEIYWASMLVLVDAHKFYDVPNRDSLYVSSGSTQTYRDAEAQPEAAIYSIKNLSQSNKEIWTIKAGPLLAIDIPTLSLVMENPPLDYTGDRFHYDNFSAYGQGQWRNPFATTLWVGLSLKETWYPTLYTDWPASMKTQVDLSINTSGRAWVTSIAAFWAKNTARHTDGGLPFTYADYPTTFPRLTLNDPVRDSWDAYEYQVIRDWWAGGYAGINFFSFKNNPYPSLYCFYSGGDAYRTAFVGAWSGSEAELRAFEMFRVASVAFVNNGKQNSGYQFMCTKPRWGQAAYGNAVNVLNHLDATRTFYVHINGSYAYWDTSRMYDHNGIGPETNAGNYDIDKVEQMVHDKIHLQGTGKFAKTKLDTTFMALYNAAVAAGTLAGTLEVGIGTMAVVDMQASFVLAATNPFTCRANWDGGSYTIADDQVLDPADSSNLGMWQGVSLNSSWNGQYPTYDKVHRHIRYAQPILIEL